MRMRLGLRLSLIMAFVGVVPLALTSYHAVGVATQRAERAADQMLEGDARRMSAIVETWLEGRGAQVAGWLDVYPSLATKPANEQAALLRAAFLAQRDATVLVLVDGDGDPLADVPPAFLQEDPARGATESDVRALMAHLPVAEVASRAQEAQGDDRAVFAVGRAFVREDGRVAVPLAAARPTDPGLVLGASVDASSVFVRLVRSQLAGDRVVAWLDHDGVPLFEAPQGQIDYADLRPLFGLAAPFKLRERGLRGAIAPVDGSDWSLVVAEGAQVTALPSAELRWQTLAVTAVSALLAVLLGLVSARWVSEPVQELRASALRLAEGDFRRRAQVLTRDELGDLAEAFNHMADRLEQTLSENAEQRSAIESFNEELQEQIAAATSELRQAQAHLVQSGQLAAVAEVSAGLAHELNNPLTAVLGMAQLLAHEHRDDPRLQKLIEQVERCRQVVMSMVRLDTDTQSTQDGRSADLGAVVRELVDVLGPTFRRRGVQIHVEGGEGGYAVTIGPVMARRILAQVLHALCAGLEHGQSLEVRLMPDHAIALLPSQPVAEGRRRDDWRASGLGFWVARQLLAEVGGALLEPSEQTGSAWVVRLPGGGLP